MFWYLLVSVALAGTSAAPTTESSGVYMVPNDTVTCAKDLTKWCDDMKYPQEGVGMSMISINMHLPNEGYCRVLCISDSEGTNCTKNGQPWFSCSKDHEFLYKGKTVDPENPEEGICETAEKAFNDIMVQNLSYDNETVAKALESGLESFFKEMSEMREMIENLSRRISRPFEGGWPMVWWGEGGREEEGSPDGSVEDQGERE